MKWTSTIKEIGKQALDGDHTVILFGPDATDKLRLVSVIQEFEKETPINNFVFKKGDTITIDGTTYLASYVGSMVEMNMKALGHATLYFGSSVPKKPLANAIYLETEKDTKMPKFKVNDWIMFEHK